MKCRRLRCSKLSLKHKVCYESKGLILVQNRLFLKYIIVLSCFNLIFYSHFQSPIVQWGIFKIFSFLGYGLKSSFAGFGRALAYCFCSNYHLRSAITPSPFCSQQAIATAETSSCLFIILRISLFRNLSLNLAA